MSLKDLAEDLAGRRARTLEMGGADAVAKEHGAGKLTARERIDRLFDAGTFTEIGAHATHAGIAPDLAGKHINADGVITGTVMAGSMGRNAETKCNRAREIAYTKRIPMIWLIDSAGARIQEAIGSRWFAGSGLLFRVAAGGGNGRARRRRHRVHPGPRRFRADGEGDQHHGARRPAAGEGEERSNPGGALAPRPDDAG